MLYKKIHRQYLREFRIGRKYRIANDERVVAKKPYIHKNGKYIMVFSTIDGSSFCSDQVLITIGGNGLFLGQFWHKDDITWLD